MMTTEALFEHMRWTVVDDGEGAFDVIDHEGDQVDNATDLETAIEACREQAEESYRTRLWETIQDTDWSDVPTCYLQTIADLLGRDHRRI